jgi:hypothetical protein
LVHVKHSFKAHNETSAKPKQETAGKLKSVGAGGDDKVIEKLKKKLADSEAKERYLVGDKR